MDQKNRQLAREVFELVRARILNLRIEVALLEIEGNGLRTIASEILRKLENAPRRTDSTISADALEAVHHKWAEQAQRYSVQAGSAAKLLLDKSRQMLQLVEFLKTKLNELRFEPPEVGDELAEWDEILFESDSPAATER